MDDDHSWVVARTAAGAYHTDITAGRHTFAADEPVSVAGGDTGPTPYDYLLGALGACTAMTIHMYAARKKWPLDDVIVRLRSARSYAADCENCDAQPVGIRRIERQIELCGSLTDEQRQRLLAIADHCPVKQTFERGLQIVAAVEPASP
jgi:putative redox protein